MPRCRLGEPPITRAFWRSCNVGRRATPVLDQHVACPRACPSSVVDRSDSPAGPDSCTSVEQRSQPGRERAWPEDPANCRGFLAVEVHFKPVAHRSCQRMPGQPGPSANGPSCPPARASRLRGDELAITQHASRASTPFQYIRASGSASADCRPRRPSGRFYTRRRPVPYSTITM